MLVGRERERASIRTLLDDARAGRGGAILIRGEAGVGKTALLRDAEAQAAGMQLARAVGVEAESEIAFAAVDQLVRPLRRLLGRLPAKLLGAVEGSLALDPSTSHRFAVGIALLELLAAAAHERPVLMLVDDAQWIDSASAEAVLFVGRRVSTEAVALVVATRDPPRGLASRPGLPELVVEGLAATDALSIVEACGRTVAPHVAQAIIVATAGNPLALQEALRSLDDGQLSGAEPLPPLLPAGEAIVIAYRRRREALSPEARQALLLAAANDSDELSALAAALAAAGLEFRALDEAVEADLVRLRAGSVEFQHPLARSAIYEAASVAARRLAHRALAAALADPTQFDRRAWHYAIAAERPDEDVAAALELSAGQALRRGGVAAAAAALRRAASLTPDVGARVERLAAAADAARQAGRIDEAISVVEQGLQLTDDSEQRARLNAMRGDAEYSRVPSLATASYLAASELLEPQDRARSVLMLGHAVACLGPAGRYRAALRLTDRAVALHDPASDVSLMGLVIAFAFSGRSADAADALAARPPADWLRAFAAEPILLTEIGYAHFVAERYDDAALILDRVIANARAGAALGVLAYALQVACWGAFETGRWLDVRAQATEAAALGEELGVLIDAAWAEAILCVAAGAQGREGECRGLVEKVNAAASALDSLELTTLTSTALGLLALGNGNAVAAVDEFESVRQFARHHGHHPSFSRWLPNLAEAYVRAGRRDKAGMLLTGVPEWRAADALTWGAAGDARCRGLLAAPDELDRHFERALELHAGAGNPFERARTELCYGERLRRARRRAEARQHLREAYLVFQRLGAEPWTRRAAAELEATGAAVEPSGPPALAELTPHELRVASIVASGATNREIASRLFVTQKTVEYHLRAIYRKLNVRSRSDLTRLYLAEQAAPAAG